MSWIVRHDSAALALINSRFGSHLPEVPLHRVLAPGQLHQTMPAALQWLCAQTGSRRLEEELQRLSDVL